MSIHPEQLDALVDQYPLLNAAGYGVPDDGPEDLRTLRAELRQSLDQVSRCAEWYRRVPWTRTLHRSSPTSYRIKHAVEEASGVYISNGAAIAAALLVEVPVRLNQFNPRIGVSSLTAALYRQRVADKYLG